MIIEIIGVTIAGISTIAGVAFKAYKLYKKNKLTKQIAEQLAAEHIQDDLQSKDATNEIDNNSTLTPEALEEHNKLELAKISTIAIAGSVISDYTIIETDSVSAASEAATIVNQAMGIAGRAYSSEEFA